MSSTKPTIAILGAGPIGLEAALYARNLGLPTVVYEVGRAGNHPRQWGHVRLFTPWELDMSDLGRRRLRETGWEEPAEGDLPTGAELVERYLEPLCRLPEMEGVVRENTRVIGLSRGDLLKGDGVGDGTRAEKRFRILVESGDREEMTEADVVLDATGNFGQPNALGQGGIPAPGERAMANLIATGLPDFRGRDRKRYQGQRVLVVGGGMSAATSITDLRELPGVEVHWVTRTGTPPIEEIAEDPLPARLDLARRANAAAGGSGAKHHPQCTVAAIEPASAGLRVRLCGPSGEHSVTVDRIVNQTGFHPDASIHRELQVHQCYASEGPMKLAAMLLGAGGGDCMTQESHGPDALKNPEPGFYILGHKSYGRGSQFLLRVGREQVRDVFRLITGNAELDLYEAVDANV